MILKGKRMYKIDMRNHNKQLCPVDEEKEGEEGGGALHIVEAFICTLVTVPCLDSGN